jgi:hypothetical protein
VCDTLGINSPVSATHEPDRSCLASLKIAPNPVNSVFYITDTGCNVVQLQLYDLTGRLCGVFKTGNIDAENGYNVEYMAAGYYLIKLLTSTGQVISRPLVIQHGK